MLRLRREASKTGYERYELGDSTETAHLI